MYAYCGNNPVCYSDPSGHLLAEIITYYGAEIVVTIVICGIVLISGLVFTTVAAFTDWLSLQWYATFPRISYATKEAEATQETLPRQGPVSEDPEAPSVDAGKQGKHVEGHNNYDPSKSSWPKGQTGVAQTQEAWQNGVPDPKVPSGNVRIGIASDGTIVRVHIDGNGLIHGYPLYLAHW